MAHPSDIIVTESEAAHMLRLSPRTMQRLRADGAGPPIVHLTERRVGYRIIDLNDWAAARVSSAGSPSPEAV